ncbi:MAG TPA: cytochrome c [Blastocatellia bacterium]|nr:cytochrome c [Blastocatellia bacterium]
MKALKTGLVITLTVLFYIACGSPQTANQNGPVQPSNSNTSSTAATPTGDQANANATSKPINKADPVAGVDAVGLFEKHKCALCHGVDGKGKAKGAPDFTNAEWQAKESNDELIKQIKEGDPPKMPAYKDKLSDIELKALVGHIRSFAK